MWIVHLKVALWAKENFIIGVLLNAATEALTLPQNLINRTDSWIMLLMGKQKTSMKCPSQNEHAKKYQRAIDQKDTMW